MTTSMEHWLADSGARFEAARLGLVCNPASINSERRHSAELLRQAVGDRLTCLIAPEHGFLGVAGPGEAVADGVHPEWQIPVYSQYNATPETWQAIARRVDWVLFDLQDLGVTCYTYVHTLRQVLEAGAREAFGVVVLDRPVPFAATLDGPMREEAFASVVAPIPAPFLYGMTPGEAARWLVQELNLPVELQVVPVPDWTRHAVDAAQWPEWVAPSPAIRSWACAACFPATVFTEALPQIDCARATTMAFQQISATGMNPEALLEGVTAHALPGIAFAVAAGDRAADGDRPALILRVTDMLGYRPALTALTVIYELQRIGGRDWLWQAPEARPEWFDRLFGTDRVRQQLMDEVPPDMIAAEWLPIRSAFEQQRSGALLYPLSKRPA